MSNSIHMEFAIKLKEKTGKEFLSYTSVKHALADMRLFELYVQGKLERRTDSLTFGSVYDCLLFTPEDFNTRFVVFDDLAIVNDIGGRNPRATKEYKEWKSQFSRGAGEREVVSLEDYQKAIDMISRIMETEAHKYLIGKYQEELQGFIGFVPVRGFLDCLGSGFVSDSKTTRSISSFKRDVYAFGYDIQAYIYKSLSGQDDYYWVAQDTSYPYTPAVYKARQETINGGKYKFDQAVKTIDSYLNSNDSTMTFSLFGEI